MQVVQPDVECTETTRGHTADRPIGAISVGAEFTVDAVDDGEREVALEGEVAGGVQALVIVEVASACGGRDQIMGPT